jgi:hypothetical protein
MKTKYILLSLLLLLSACNAIDDIDTPDAALEIKGIVATIDGNMPLTRAVDAASSIGRSAFVENDVIVFTKIKRTNQSLEDFSYSGIQYGYDGQSWNRLADGQKEKIYWTDGFSAHTFIGYSLPLSNYNFDNGDGTYSGQLGTTDFSAGSSAMAAEDVLITYSDTTKAETGGLTTKVYFTHALSNVRVVVDIKGYASNSSAKDIETKVSDMIIESQPTKFTWNTLGSSLSVPTDNQITKDLKLWCQKEDGDGSGQNKTFTFYGLNTPHNGDVPFKFTVTYPDPQNAGSKLSNTYKGTFSGVNFKSGMCTTLRISLNHEGEQMTMGVEYSDWNYVATPDLGALRKKSTYMDISIDSVTIHTMDGLSADDATWLYKKGNDVLDIYGNDGENTPYRITSAAQMLSFAKEVNSGYDFNGKTIRLDADITMQKSATKSDYSWDGIGTGSVAFNGTFLGGDRYINRLQGGPLFSSLGANACVEQLYITTTGTVTNGALAGTNNGVIGACKVIDEVETTSGVLVGTNNGTIYACSHTGAANDAKLVGTNNAQDKTIGCYVASDYSAITSAIVDNMNKDLNGLYEVNTTLTQYEYVYSAGSYPTVKKK